MSTAPFKPDFSLTTSTGAAGEPVIAVAGELDSGTCDELLVRFRETLSEGAGEAITLDLSGLSFIDSAGTRSVIMMEREARDQGLSLVIAPPPNEVTELLRTAGVIEHFQLGPSSRSQSIDTPPRLERVELRLPSEAQSPGRARAEVRELLGECERTQAGDVVLLTSEIVTNAVVHPATPPEAEIGLRIFTYPEGIRIEVDDDGQGFDPTLPIDSAPDGGRGLFLVDRFASRWGTDHLCDDRGTRFVVWFELDWREPGNVETASR